MGMVKRKVTITVEVDPRDYYGAENTEASTVDIVVDILRGRADFAGEVIVACGAVQRKIRLR